ncbi:HET-domain-containing protein, partial [Thozetella sp. PMI_491]
KDLSRATSWLETCRTSHAKCGTQGAAEPAMPALPSRVLDVSRREVLEDIVLFEAHSSRGQYVALSHRWGDAKISKTMTSTIQEYTARLPISSLSKTFQDAIYVTRELGYRYLWIDSLCIIQDSPDDWEAESSRMAEVYSNASLIISASVASSGDSGLFYPKPAQSLLSSFTEDVERGSLARRAWCLQERVLARRILHFGKDQLHWECLSGCWSEALEETLKDLEVTGAEEFGPKQIYSRGPYGKWYRLLNAYSNRELTVEGDRLPALGGLASVFEKFSRDQYVAGLWLDDIPAGLLWSGTELYRPVDSPSLLRRPAKRQAPSWSWTSFEGQIFY